MEESSSSFLALAPSEQVPVSINHEIFLTPAVPSGVTPVSVVITSP